MGIKFVHITFQTLLKVTCHTETLDLFKHMDQSHLNSDFLFGSVPLMNITSFLLFDLHKCYIVCFGREVSSSPWREA